MPPCVHMPCSHPPCPWCLSPRRGSAPSCRSCLSPHLPAASELPDPGPEPEGAGPGEVGLLPGARDHRGCPGPPGDRPHRNARGGAPHAGGRGLWGGHLREVGAGKEGCLGAGLQGREGQKSELFFPCLQCLPQTPENSQPARAGGRMDRQTEGRMVRHTAAPRAMPTTWDGLCSLVLLLTGPPAPYF